MRLELSRWQIDDEPSYVAAATGFEFGGDDLELQRDIRSKNTTQQYSLKKESDNKFAGTFWNVGPPENRDQGSFEITR